MEGVKQSTSSSNAQQVKNHISVVRDTIFIGHANPEDDEFTLWLRSKLINEGYKVECDLTFLIGGENDYWKSLQDLLEQGTAKYLLVFSKNAFLKPGVIDEWEQVKAIGQKNGLQDFRLVCKIDDVSYSERIGLNVMNQLRFDKSWGFGLKQLLNKLRADHVTHGARNKYSIDDWLRNKYTTTPFLHKKKETYYSNWIEIPAFPCTVFFHEYSNDSQAKLIASEIKNHAAINHDKYVVTFLKEVPITSSAIDFTIEARKVIPIPTEYYLSNDNLYDFPAHADMKRFMVRLIKDAFFKYMGNRGVNFHLMSSNTHCYYYKQGQLEDDKVSYLYKGNWQRPKQLLGDYFEAMWHYGISIRPILRPFPRLAIKGHLLFSNDGQNIWDSKKEIQTARRRKGRGFFNADWRNLMLAFMHSIADDDGIIAINFSETETTELSATPILFESNFGYTEPGAQARLIPLDNDVISFSEEEEMFDIEESEEDECLDDDDNETQNEMEEPK